MIINSQKQHLADSLATPESLFKKCCELWGITPNIDICATAINSKCLYYMNKETDALNHNWRFWHCARTDLKTLTLREQYNKYPIIWGNFPHSQNKLFIEKSFEQWNRFDDMTIMILIPVNTLCSNYAFKYIHGFAEIKFLQGRPKFLDPITNKPSKYNSVNGYCTLLYRKRK